MNTRNVEGRVVQKYGSLHGSYFGSSSDSSENSGSRPRGSMGLQPDAMLSGGDPRQYNLVSLESSVCSDGFPRHTNPVQANPSTVASSRSGSMPSAFYAIDRHMGFSQFDHQRGTLPLFVQPRRSSEAPPCQINGSGFPANFQKANDVYCQSQDTLESVVTLSMRRRQNNGADDGYQVPHLGNPHAQKLHQPFPRRPGGDYSLGVRNLGVCNPRIGFCESSSPDRPNLQIPLDRQQQQVSMAPPVKPNPVPPKTRIRWTQELHERFVESVSRLGGSEKATPKGILKLMGTEGLTIYHVKSHLQKYRIAKYIPDSAEGKNEKRDSFNELEQLDSKTGIQITEALRIQLEVQRRLHEQLEIQRNIQKRIEEQGRQLQKMFEQQQIATKSLIENQGADVSLSDDEPVSLGDVQTCGAAEGSENTRFPSKIS
ncbi:hypothetical protein Taro_007640 [Colocasia esculenta]|uniref:HTH myb-type domain-containing protein n=1 Tax=Colocasia esculenta TaxID=4460 RepID=A0A843TYT2_COLES|nr:hypothetical protein [Colocasia esculenta]